MLNLGNARQVTILYATHIFDGLHTWGTHFVFLSDGKLRRAGQCP